MKTKPKFIRLHHRKREGSDARSVIYDLYECFCGRLFVGNRRRVNCGDKSSCGCWLKDNARRLFTTHGQSKTITYNSWLLMNRRCNNPKAQQYRWYGAKGIKVLYKSFEEFIQDVGPRPKGMSIDRIDNNGNYTPGNCKWSTQKEQCQNRGGMFASSKIHRS